MERATGNDLDELLTELEALTEPTERNRKTFVRYWAAERSRLMGGVQPSDTPTKSEMSVQAVSVKYKVKIATKDNPFVNSLGMKFVPVPGTDILFSIWETRGKDYEAYANAVSGVDDEWKRPGFAQTADDPVVKVSIIGAWKFAEWLTEKERQEGLLTAQQRYRLPTDLEWSQAVGLVSETGTTPEARSGGVKNVFPWGTQWPPPFGAGNYDPILVKDPVGAETRAVGSFSPNEFGIFDLGGNVWEWCDDSYDRTGPHVVRGASFDSFAPEMLLSSYRSSRNVGLGYRYYNVGFRLVLVGESAR